MSTDWHVHCLDCSETHTFDDANRQSDEMLLLCKHAAAIAGLAQLIRESSLVEIRTPHGRIEAEWFAKHAGHRLAPIDEYGRALEIGKSKGGGE